MKKIIIASVAAVLSAVVAVSAHAARTSPETDPETIFAQEKQVIHRVPVKEEADRQSASAAGNYFRHCLSTDERGATVYPDTYGGCYISDDGKFVLQVTTVDHSEYLFIQEEFPCTVFEQVEYSFNYLHKLAENYILGHDPEKETVYGGGVDVYKNRAFIEVDEETFSQKTNDPESLIQFRVGWPTQFLSADVENEQSASGFV